MSTKFFEHSEGTNKEHRIDRQAGVIRGVRVLGSRSKNRREYSDRAIKDAIRLYENARVNLDHDKQNPGTRSVGEAWGRLRSVRRDGDCVRADLHYLKKHPMTEAILEAIERFPDARFGLSHAAEGPSHRRGETLVIEGIDKVYSVDLVQNPATNETLFEDRSSYLDARSLLKRPGGYVHATPRPRPNRRGAQPGGNFDAYVATIYEETAGDEPNEVAAAFESAALAIIKKRQPLNETLAKIEKLLRARDEALGGDAASTTVTPHSEGEFTDDDRAINLTGSSRQRYTLPNNGVLRR